jgi:hypothetical protein
MAKLKPNSQPLRNPGESIEEAIERVIHDIVAMMGRRRRVVLPHVILLPNAS